VGRDPPTQYIPIYTYPISKPAISFQRVKGDGGFGQLAAGLPASHPFPTLMTPISKRDPPPPRSLPSLFAPRVERACCGMRGGSEYESLADQSARQPINQSTNQPASGFAVTWPNPLSPGWSKGPECRLPDRSVSATTVLPVHLPFTVSNITLSPLSPVPSRDSALRSLTCRLPPPQVLQTKGQPRG